MGGLIGKKMSKALSNMRRRIFCTMTFQFEFCCGPLMLLKKVFVTTLEQMTAVQE